ncbi:AfsR/SARP family transcriptional regulator [Streptomyces sp. TRM66268-LWL]|uniref:AfsR/SARP family transcriptional regulator n=1 Tax=Streptomyces polyasparticus TaxID=2767826 RepID=A0ABR7S9G2_9ACTN|nr:AfsR/SARP family transcriptional regulator [Streptomyces polyasparticus]MBC9712110.1 AfsR/SARP family transcriptional regulator [Streptomyces polyasparticus]
MSGVLLRDRHGGHDCREHPDRSSVTLLGPFVVRRAGVETPLGPPRQQALLAVLLLQPGRTLGLKQLVDALWGEHPPAHTKNLLQKYLSGLRPALAAHGMTVEWTGTGYRLDPGDACVDLYEYDRLASAGRTALAAGEPVQAARLLDRARALKSGPLAEGLDAPLLERERVFTRSRLLVDFELRAELELDLGRHREAIPYLECLVHAHALHERFVWLLMLALHRAGRDSEALAVHRDHRRRLAAELGAEPGPALKDLELAVLRQDPALASLTALSSAPRPTAVAH